MPNHHLFSRGVFNFLRAGLYLFVLTSTAFSQGHRQDFEARTHSSPTVNMVYRLFIPENYSEEEAYPIVVALHGVGERGNNNTSQIDLEDLIWPWIEDSVQAKVPHFIMVPQCPSEQTWTGSPQDGILEILDDLQSEFSLDTNRFYITGLSMGGAGAWGMIQNHPGVFAAAVPTAAGGNTGAIETIAETPFWAFHGSDDARNGEPGNRRMADAAENAGIPVVRFVSEVALPVPSLSDYRDALASGTDPVDLVGLNPSGISWDSLTRAVEGGADHLYSELTGGDHRSGWMIAWHNPLLAPWVFSKSKGEDPISPVVFRLPSENAQNRFILSDVNETKRFTEIYLLNGKKTRSLPQRGLFLVSQ